MRIKQTVLGCGRWGSFHAWYGNRVGNRVTLWEPEGSPVLANLRATRRNEYLVLPDDIILTDDLEEAISDAVFINIAIPAQELRNLAIKLRSLDLSDSFLILCMKGLEYSTGKRLSEIVVEEGLIPAGLVAWIGPGHPQQFLAGVPSCMLLVSDDKNVVQKTITSIASDLIRFYRSEDMIGCEIGAAAKNVIGIAAGMLDGLGMEGLKGALMARGPQEVARLVSALGGDWRSVYGLSHLGDYEATLFSEYSRNRGFGFSLARGENYSGLVEGVPTTHAMLELAKPCGVDLPITKAVSTVLSGELTPGEVIEMLFMRPAKDEFPEQF